jgi:hypothetical protein
LFIAINIFAQNVSPSAQDTQSQKQEKLLKRQEEYKRKSEEKQQKRQQQEQKKQEVKQKKEQEKLLKKQQKEQKKLEEQKRASEDKQKAEQEQIQKQESKKIRLEEKQKKKVEKQRKKEERKLEKSEKKKRKLQKNQEMQGRISSLILDYDLRFAAVSYSNLDYTSQKAKSENIYRQYLAINMIGRFDERIEMSAKLVSYGLSGKRNEIFNMTYSQDDFSFFLESAYLNFRSETDALIPYILTFGKQYFTVGDGFIIDSNQNGLLGARVKADILDFFSVDAFAGKVDNLDFGVYGGNIKFKIFPEIEIGVYQERNDTGFAYEKGVFIDSSAYVIKSDIKTFYDIRLTGGNQKYKYRLEAAQQTGKFVKTSTDTTDYEAFAFIAEGSWKGLLLNRQSNAKMIFSYAEAENDNSFNPTFARRYDGIQRVGYGTLFAASSSDSFLILPEGYRGINTIGVNFDITPWNFLQTGFGFYMYSASDAPSDAGDAGFSKLYGAKTDLGNEFDFFVKYEYLNYFDINLMFAMYTPPSNGYKVFSNMETSYLFQIEVNAKF